MKNMRKMTFLSILLVALLALVAVGCTPEEEADEQPGDEPTVQEAITIGYVTWDCAIASTHVLQTVLEDAGIEVDLIDPNASLLYEGLANGDIDVITTAWLPFTHASYMNQVGDQVDDLGSNYGGEARIGLVVPAYMDVDSIEDLAGQADNRIIGIDPGAGIMGAAESAIEAYGLDYELLDGSDAAMAATLADAIANEEEVIVTGWAPHWKFGRWDLKFLDDPKEEFGAAEDIHTIARQGLAEDAPTAFEIINNFHWEDADIATVMDMNSDGMDPKESARIWVDENQDKVQEWLQ
ncbi:glycine betaine/proline transport system substrate-binding protein [Desulfitispora alkaliphila]|uniref:glycine betaine ABC transporter substrate-binding protein n=1 Tax=Desulfitispora alkaliphila TaxID=622674 RepID=UPI003D19F83B